MRLVEVFGVSKDPVQSYIERALVDTRMERALASTRQIVVYGSSKQGKTSLVGRHLAGFRRVTVYCAPSMSLEDLYRSLLRQMGIEVHIERIEVETSDGELAVSVSAQARVPLLAQAEMQGELRRGSGRSASDTYRVIEFNLGLAQDVAELMKSAPDLTPDFLVLENFHYLEPSAQAQFAFDLRTFEELGTRFIILGVWREANRLLQFNGDLQDRLDEVPVEPWTEEDFGRVLTAGEEHLNIRFSTEIKARVIEEAHGSIAIVQELAKLVCHQGGIESTVHEDGPRPVTDATLVQAAVAEKVEDYTSRYVRSLESIAAGSRTRRTTENTVALYLPYYMVSVLLSRPYTELQEGIERKRLQELMQELHPAKDHIRTSDVTSMLTRLAQQQASANIVPPLLGYDQGTRRLKVVDSTLYFFLDNCDLEEVRSGIAHPDPEHA